MSPQQVQQMLAQYKSQFGGANPLSGFDAAQQSLGAGAPQGANMAAGGVNAASQLIVALLRAQKQKQLQQQVQGQQQPQTPVPSQGTSLASDPSPAGMGVPDGGSGAGT
jgi:hypothetical protein